MCELSQVSYWILVFCVGLLGIVLGMVRILIMCINLEGEIVWAGLRQLA